MGRKRSKEDAEAKGSQASAEREELSRRGVASAVGAAVVGALAFAGSERQAAAAPAKGGGLTPADTVNLAGDVIGPTSGTTVASLSGTGGYIALNPAATITQTQSGLAGLCPFLLFPDEAKRAPFGLNMGTETGYGGATNPAMAFGYNIGGQLGSERAMFVIEENYASSVNGETVYDTEMHLEFFDANNKLVTRSFGTTYWLPPLGYVETSISFLDGSQPGSFTIWEQANGELIRVQSNFFRLEAFDAFTWSWNRSPLITQDDNEVNATANPLTVRPGRANFYNGAASPFVVQLRAANGSGLAGYISFQSETATSSDTFAEWLRFSNISGNASVDASGGFTCSGAIMSFNATKAFAAIGSPTGIYLNAPEMIFGTPAGVTYATLTPASFVPQVDGGLALGNPSQRISELFCLNAAVSNYVELGNTAQPSTPTNGPRVFGRNGAAQVIGTSGTVTTFGPAEPHCPKCGADFMTEHQNPKYGYLAVCLKCMADFLGEQPWIIRKKPQGAATEASSANKKPKARERKSSKRVSKASPAA